MSSVSKREQDLILDLLLDRVSPEEFLRQYPVERAELPELVLGMLQAAVRQHDPVAVEFGLYLAYYFELFTERYLDTLHCLAVADWHQRHEDVVSALGKLKSPSSVAALFTAALARHSYLEHDEAFALGVKAIWALGAIDAPEAIARLDELRTSENSILATEAEAQLKRIANGERSGKSDAQRSLAANAMARNRARGGDA